MTKIFPFYVKKEDTKKILLLLKKLSIRLFLFLEFSDALPYHYTNRYSYKLFQSLLSCSKVNLFERLLDQYELNNTSTKSITTSLSSDDTTLLHTRFVSPNSAHIAQILRCLRDYAATFDNYLLFFKSTDQQQVNEDADVLEIRWQAALDYLNDDEKKWSSMHHTEPATSNFRIISSANYLSHMIDTNNTDDPNEESRRSNKFQIKSFRKGTSFFDEDDDDVNSK